MRSKNAREWGLNAHDGVMSTSGMLQGFAGAGAGENALVLAAAALMVAGALTTGARAFSESAGERAAQELLEQEEAAELVQSPEDAHRHLSDHYIQRGLKPALADVVAAQLIAAEPIGAILEAEHGILSKRPSAWAPWWAGLRAASGFIVGALPLTIAIMFVHESWREPVVLGIAIIALVGAGLLSAWAGSGDVRRTIARSVLTGLIVAAVAFAAGTVFEWVDQFVLAVDLRDLAE